MSVFSSKEIVLIKQVTAKLGSFHSSPKVLARNPVVSVYICGERDLMGIWCFKVVISVLQRCFIKTSCGYNERHLLFLLVKATYLLYFPLWESSVKIKRSNITSEKSILQKMYFID